MSISRKDRLTRRKKQLNSIRPKCANYYNSKGEFLFRKGDKKGALEMWIKVKSLEPDLDQKHDSYLSRQMYKQ